MPGLQCDTNAIHQRGIVPNICMFYNAYILHIMKLMIVPYPNISYSLGPSGAYMR